jgi:hypothetical protein
MMNERIMDVIHAAADADTSKFTYEEVYASAAATPTINGTVVSMAAGSKLRLRVKTITATANVFVLGYNLNIATGSPFLGSNQTI